jgi:hypothetical protein
MSKNKSNKVPPEFERFQNFARALIAVPRKELEEQMRKYRQTKPKKRKRH